MASKALRGLGAGLVQLAQTGIQFKMQQMRDEFMAAREDERLAKTQEFQAAEGEKTRTQQTELSDKELTARAAENENARLQQGEQFNKSYDLQKQQLTETIAARREQLDELRTTRVMDAQQKRIADQMALEIKRLEAESKALDRQAGQTEAGAKIIGEAGKIDPLTQSPLYSKESSSEMLDLGRSLVSQRQRPQPAAQQGLLQMGGLGQAPAAPAPSNFVEKSSVAPMTAPQSAVQALQQNPSLRNDFLSKYGYLPSGL